MKRVLVVFCVLALTFVSAACSTLPSKNNKADSIEKIQECEHLIDNIGKIKNGGFIDKKGKVHRDSGISNYEEALNAYNELTDSQKEQVSNRSVLEDKKTAYDAAKEDYDLLLIKSTCIVESKDPFVSAIKEKLKSSSSYEENDWGGTFADYDTKSGKYKVYYNIDFSATNSFGGRLDYTAMGEVSGVYTNGKCSELKANVLTMHQK